MKNHNETLTCREKGFLIRDATDDESAIEHADTLCRMLWKNVAENRMEEALEWFSRI